ncbi:hypothetical protein AAT19DRAFT_11245, partial [Rhodotorula toruloides]
LQNTSRTALLLLAGPAKQPTMPKDYLTSLPPELFDYICRLVHAYDPETFSSSNQYLGSISKAFLPFARQRVFPRLYIQDERKAERVLGVLAASPEAAACVTSLTLSLLEDALSTQNIKASVLNQAISNLVRVKTLSITGAGRFAKALLSPRKAGLLPCLEDLFINGRFVGWADPLAPSFYRNLARYSSLAKLNLNIKSKHDGRSQRPKAVERIAMPWSFWLLALSGQGMDSPTANVLAASLGSQALSFFSYDNSTRTMSDRLIDLPKSVIQLYLAQPHSMRDDITPALEKIPWVVALGLGAGFHFSTILRSLSRVLPQLIQLEVQADNTLTVEDILAVLQGPQKVAGLRLLFLHSPFYGDHATSLKPAALISVVEVAERENVALKGKWGELAIAAKKRRDERVEAEGGERAGEAARDRESCGAGAQ